MRVREWFRNLRFLFVRHGVIRTDHPDELARAFLWPRSVNAFERDDESCLLRTGEEIVLIPPKPEFYRTSNGRFKWRTRGSDGSVHRVSPKSYARKRDAMRGFERAKA